mgnify:CR=1 FL=1
MRLIFSDEIKRLSNIIQPYIDYWTIPPKLKENAPQEIKEAYQKFKELAKKEYEDAMM